jgi:hypothetical protein
MTQFRQFQFVMIAVIAILCVLATVAICNGQEPILRAVPQGIFQRVQIEHEGVVRQFSRHMGENDRWSIWEEWPAMDMRQDAHTFKPRTVDQKDVEKVLGVLNRWLDERGRTVGVSGYYNFTRNPIYDWKKFAGDSYGTYTQERIDLTTDTFIDLSKFKLPILKGE